MFKKYRYEISFSYTYNDKQYIANMTNIKYVHIEYDYINNHMPFGIISASLDRKLIDDMISNQGKKRLSLHIKKYLVDSSMQLKQTVIDEEFTYFIDGNEINKFDTLDYAGDADKNKDLLKPITIGFISERLINNNKKTINDVARNTSLLELLLYHMRHMKVLIEPVNNFSISEFIIPPCSSITKLIEYVNKFYSLYNGGYILFYDFDKTYLLSSNSKKYIKSINDKIDNITFNITESKDPKYITEGMDMEENTANINIPISDIKIYEDKSTNKSYDNIIAITPDGTYKKVNINLEGSDNSNKKKNKIIKLQTNNLESVNQYKSLVETNSTTISFFKADIDSSIFTINKIYNIKNNNKLKDKSGQYKLIHKTDVYAMTNNEFILCPKFVFKKI